MSADDRRESFRYKDHHDGKHKAMTLPTEHFMTRVLWHVAVTGQHQVRHYGLYAGGARDKRDLVRSALGVEVEISFVKLEKDTLKCPECGHALMHVLSTRREISYIGSRHVQQNVRATSQRGIFHDGSHLTSQHIFLAPQGRST
ncbi:MAG: transposase [Candidatus Thiodiazotropha sp.]